MRNTFLHTTARRVFNVFVLSSTAATPLFAQNEPSSCAPLVRATAIERPRATDIERLSGCPVSGPNALAGIWSRLGAVSTADLGVLVETSDNLRDGQIYRSVLAASSDASQATTKRLAAIQVLTAYYDGRLAPSVAYLTGAHLGDPVPMSVHRGARVGRTHLPDSRISDVPALLARLAQQDLDPVVRGAALRLRQALAFHDPEHTPLAAGVVSLEAGCGPRVSLQSNADVTLALRVRVIASDYDNVFSLKGSVENRPSKLLLAPPAGTVVVTFGSRELARLAKRDAPCPPGVTKR